MTSTCYANPACLHEGNKTLNGSELHILNSVCKIYLSSTATFSLNAAILKRLIDSYLVEKGRTYQMQRSDKREVNQKTIGLILKS